MAQNQVFVPAVPRRIAEGVLVQRRADVQVPPIGVCERPLPYPKQKMMVPSKEGKVITSNQKAPEAGSAPDRDIMDAFIEEMSFPPKQKLLGVPTKAGSEASRSASPVSRNEEEDELPESLSSRASSAEPSKQGAKQQLAELLDIWRSRRHSTEPLAEEERQRIEKVLFETMPADRVSIVEVRRVVKPSLLRRFCEEERDSLMKQANQQKTHKQFMLLHGTRWDYAPLIVENGLDPSCGHLTKGTWLGGIAEKAHSYAAKGPGPEVEGPDGPTGNRLFTLFVVAAVPDISDGDDERSFGVWRVQSGRRLYTAYQVIYSAPMDLRRKAPLIVPRSNKAVLLRKQSYDKLETGPLSSRTSRCRSASPPRRTTSPELPVGPGGLPLDLPGKVPAPQSPKEIDAASSWPLDGLRLGGFRGACTSPALKVHQPDTPSPRPPVSVYRRTSAPKLLEANGPKGVTEVRASTSPSPAPRSPSAQSPSPASRTSPALKVKQPEARPPPSPRTLNRPPDLGNQNAAKWEVLLENGWVPFRPGCKFKDDAGSKVSICHGQFWYTLTFDANGSTGKQVNQRTGKARQLRRVEASTPTEQIPTPAEPMAPEEEQKQQDLAAGGWFPSLLNSNSPVKQVP
mmetsp:Transcript_59273/g.111059  ORF Transcript_59273/g.111059 Transcript_59273/m.111059 type:complete len:626 (+) Transcript_59273:25-1902(+)